MNTTTHVDFFGPTTREHPCIDWTGRPVDNFWPVRQHLGRLLLNEHNDMCWFLPSDNAWTHLYRLPLYWRRQGLPLGLLGRFSDADKGYHFRCGHSIQVCSTNTVVFAQYKGCSRLVGRKKSTHVVVFIQYKAGQMLSGCPKVVQRPATMVLTGQYGY